MADSLAQTLQSYTGKDDLTPRTENYLRSLESLLAPNCCDITTGMHYEEESKYVTVRFSEADVRKWGTLELIALGDIQYGSKACRIKRVIEYRDWVLEKPNRFVFMMGDNIDAATIFSPGSPFDNLFGPQSQAYRFAELFAPMRHRILAYVAGNHERRAMPCFGNIGALIATLLRIPYSSGQQFIDVHFGLHKPFKTHIWHFAGGARTKGAVAQALDRFMQRGDSQLYLGAHYHQGIVLPGWRTERDIRGRIKLVKIMGAIGTSFLEYFGSYGEVMGLNPSDLLMPRAILYPDAKWEMTLR